MAKKHFQYVDNVDPNSALNAIDFGDGDLHYKGDVFEATVEQVKSVEHIYNIVETDEKVSTSADQVAPEATGPSVEGNDNRPGAR